VTGYQRFTAWHDPARAVEFSARCRSWALVLLQESRRGARESPAGELMLLADQDRSRWNREQIVEGVMLVERALASRRAGPYSMQAAIAAVHAEARTAETTDWRQIVGLYDVLLRVDPSPVVELNRAVAVAMRDGPEAGLALGQSRAVPPGRSHGRRACCLPTGARPRSPGTGAPVHRAPDA
jgi:hypothetical protein